MDKAGAEAAAAGQAEWNGAAQRNELASTAFHSIALATFECVCACVMANNLPIMLTLGIESSRCEIERTQDRGNILTPRTNRTVQLNLYDILAAYKLRLLHVRWMSTRMTTNNKSPN